MKQILALFLALCASLYALGQSGNELQQHYVAAMEAYKNGDYSTFYASIMKAHEIHPYHQGILYQAGIASALTNRKNEAIEYLRSAVLIQSDFPLAIQDLKSLEGMPEFEALKKLREEERVPVTTSDTALVIGDRALHIEGIVRGLEENVFYAGSIRKRKIITIRNGVVSDFARPGQDGLSSVFALKVDKNNKVLWATSSPMEQMENYSATIPSAVYRFDLRSGGVPQKFLPEDPALQLILGDLALTRKGDVFVSDSKNNFIFRLNRETNKLEQFFSSDEFWNIQGITFSDDDNIMFIADYVRGIFRLDMKKMALTQVSSSLDLSLKGIDGITYYNHSLIAIQNGINPMRVTRYFLNKESDALTSATIIDRAHPAFNEPALGSLSDDTYYYVANSQWSGYEEDGNQKPPEQLQDIVVLEVHLE